MSLSCPGILKLLVWVWSEYQNFYTFPRRSYCAVKVRSCFWWDFKGGELIPDVSNCHIQESCPFLEQWLPDLSILRNLQEGFWNTNCLAPTPAFLNSVYLELDLKMCILTSSQMILMLLAREPDFERTTALEADKARLENVQTLGFFF